MRLTLALATIVCCALAPAAGARTEISRAPAYLIATPLTPLTLRAAPGGRALATEPATTVFGSPTKLAVIGQQRGWLEVVSDRLPNNTPAWVRRTDVSLASTGLSLDASLSQHRVWVLRRGQVVRSFPVAVGRAGSSTPTGVFAITDKLPGAQFSSTAYGCCILALSGTQTHTPAGWQGGNRLAIHGGGGIGWSVSAGCLHASDSDLRFLMQTLPLGTLVRIRA